MQQTMIIHSFATSDSITLYWEKPDMLPAGGWYEVRLNGAEAAVCDRTHCTLNGLQAETSYTVQVRAFDPVQEEDETIIYAESCCLELKTEMKKDLLDVTQAPYCAAGDGKTMDTQALQRAIDDCRADQAVYLPAGVYLTGALRLHSDMELYLEEGALLQGTDRVEDYLPRIWSRFEGTELECYSSLLNLGELDREGGYNCRNVVIRGKGTIASGGRTLAESVIASETERLKDYLASLGDKIHECEKPETIPGRVRPRLINISCCQNVVLSGVSLKNGASWNVHMIYSDHIITHDCTFYSENVWNGDGWDPDSSTDCTIFGCTFYTGDDSIAIKSGKNPEGNVINRPCRHIRIFDCRCAFGHGITIGSEMSGGVEDVCIWDCDMSRSMCGIEIKGTKKRGGYVKDVHVKDCRAARILFHSVGYNDDGIGHPLPPVFEDCSFERVSIRGEYYGHEREWIPCEAIELCGFDRPGHELKDIVFSDICIGSENQSRKQTLSLQYCENITFERIRCL
ncbi:glycoside hydrolase family 28 protein [Lachnotalea sp. AF33-28]|uniref:glycoside hydrolase family 28 protein n=1 Tax=Lachnotalea sp. AF33-28 TaxID=2292046 RepID=UPI000E51DF63|nr:glycoside hydrolase family 28 protein [Lachnotalea sp. AF33-28]RHP33979.1 glycoside hydrolase family 28 protein [Lachnotalea sp. AF33-28]